MSPLKLGKAAQKQIQEFLEKEAALASASPAKKSKYGNKRIETPDGKFDSIKESKRYPVLKMMLCAGEIKELKRQVKYIFHNNLRLVDSGKRISYIADFTYYQKQADGSWIFVVEDVKGFKTMEYKYKKALMLFHHGITIFET